VLGGINDWAVAALPWGVAAARTLIGGIFVLSALGKLRRPGDTVRGISRLRVLPAQLSIAVLAAVVCGELSVAAAMLLGGPLLRPGFLLAVILLVAFTVVIMSVLRRHLVTSCSCFGATDRPITYFDVVRNCVLLIAAIGSAAALSQGDPNAYRAIPTLGWIVVCGGAACLGRDDCGTLEPGKCADVAFFRVDDLAHAGMDDLLAALALAPPARAEAVVVNGKVVVREGRLLTGDETTIAREIAAESNRLRAFARL